MVAFTDREQAASYQSRLPAADLDSVGASLLDVAVRSLQQGDAEHARFRERTRAETTKAA